LDTRRLRVEKRSRRKVLSKRLASADLLQYSIFKLTSGWIAVAWSEAGLRSITFPASTKAMAEAEMKKRKLSVKRSTQTPKYIQALVKNLGLIAQGLPPVMIKPTPLDFTGVPPFHEKIYREALKVPAGTTLSYSELAKRAGSPNAARAVGQAMARNPIPLLVPCHRVLAARGKIGGFTAPGGLESKAKLLGLEGASINSGRQTAETVMKNFDAGKTVRELAKRDPKLAKLMKKIGPFTFSVAEKKSAFHRLVRSIIFQQLHGKAAATIHSRLRELFGGRDPEPQELLDMDITRLASAGLSRQKLAALKDLARAATAGQVPDSKKILRMTDEEIIEALLPIRGVGRWTVEMLLIFGLGRTDVLPIDDYAIRKSAMLLYGLPEMPGRKQLLEIGERWRPWRTIASWYLWRALD
jgi:O-6-methylguanine DNA methyltransferase